MTEKPEEENEAFELWCYNTWEVVNGISVPVLTTLMYRVCNRDHEKFDEAMRIIRMAFEAGAKQ